ncbi:hypothetical protein GCM10028801_04690 [Nocardioides maradonensis]
MLGVVLVAANPSGALAGDRGPCNVPLNHSFQGGFWDPSIYGNKPYGIEAPVQFRVGASVCEVASGEVDETSNWISIQDRLSGAISQAGFVQQILDPVANTTKNCRFWQTGLTALHPYDCGDDSGGTFVYFKVVLNSGYYRILDCGNHSDYQNCLELSATAPEYWDPVAFAAAETSHPCGDQMAGSDSNRANIGTAASPLLGQSNSLGPFNERAFVGKQQQDDGGSCSAYHRYVVPEADGTNNAQAVQTWDGRN